MTQYSSGLSWVYLRDVTKKRPLNTTRSQVPPPRTLHDLFIKKGDYKDPDVDAVTNRRGLIAPLIGPVLFPRYIWVYLSSSRVCGKISFRGDDPLVSCCHLFLLG